MILYARQSSTDNLNFTEACQEFIDRKESRRSLFRAFDNRGGSRKGTLLHLRCNFMEILIRAPESYLLLPQSTPSRLGCRNPIKFLFIFIYFKINKWIRIWDHSWIQVCNKYPTSNILVTSEIHHSFALFPKCSIHNFEF